MNMNHEKSSNSCNETVDINMLSSWEKLTSDTHLTSSSMENSKRFSNRWEKCNDCLIIGGVTNNCFTILRPKNN